MRRTPYLLVALVALALLLGYALVHRARQASTAPPTPRAETHPPSRRAPAKAPVVHGVRAVHGGTENSPLRFRDVGASAGLTDVQINAADGRFRLIETMGSGAGLIDADGDGWLDILIANGAPIPFDPEQHEHTARLYRNNRDGTFTDITARANVAFNGFGQGVAVGDYDDDRRDDLFVAGFGGSALYRNQGDGTFVDMTEHAGVRGGGWPASCAFADLDADGDLDLYVVHYLADTVDARGNATEHCRAVRDQVGYCPPHAHRPEPDVLYRNNGDGTFTDVSAEAGLCAAAGNGLGLAIDDFDDDGLLDVFVANDQTPNQLWRNLGDLRFEEVAHDWCLALGETGTARAGMGVAAGDYDGDGRTDLLITNFYEEPNTLYRNVAPGLFQVTTAQARLMAPSRGVLGFGTGFFDADNDGALDLFVSNGHINDVRPVGIAYHMPPQLFRNHGDGRFADVSGSAGPYFQGAWLGRAAGFGDLDNDGDTDAVATHIGRAPALLLNQTEPRGHFLSLRLLSSARSRSAVGARVMAHIGTRVLTRTLTAGTSYLASNDARILLGLGDVNAVDRLEVRWPSGRVESWSDLPADSFLELWEGQGPRPQRIQGK